MIGKGGMSRSGIMVRPRLANRVASASEEDGQALIEMALALPLVIMLLFGVYSLAIVLFGWCNLTCASRAAVRYASIHSTTSLVPATTASITAVVTPFLVGASPGGSTTDISYSTSNKIGGTVTVTVTATYPVVMPYTSHSSFTLTGVAKRTITR